MKSRFELEADMEKIEEAYKQLRETQKEVCWVATTEKEAEKLRIKALGDITEALGKIFEKK